MKLENIQTVFIDMDDSGQLHRNDSYCIYGGIVFTDIKKRSDFIRQYRNILNHIKCKYCKQQNTISYKCNKKCPEIKDTNVKDDHKRWIMNLLKKEFCFAVTISNHKVNDNIMNSLKSRGRFRDYAQRRIIKEILKDLIKKEKINANAPIKLIIKIDQQEVSTDTNRKFSDDIISELTSGIYNHNYSLIFPPIIFSDIEVDLKYVVSHINICIQAADFVAGETRRVMINEKLSLLEREKSLKNLSVKIHLP